jgi:GNAT superfamily N-acetyltransferase
MDFSLALTDIADDAVQQAILVPLRAYNMSKAGTSKGRPLVITVRDAGGAVVGGLWGSTSYDWLFTELLAVPETLRGRGIGRQLMTMAHDEAIERGCRGAWLDTFEFQARGFYEDLGYSVFGEIPQYPPGYSRFFMRKEFAVDAA